MPHHRMPCWPRTHRTHVHGVRHPHPADPAQALAAAQRWGGGRGGPLHGFAFDGVASPGGDAPPVLAAPIRCGSGARPQKRPLACALKRAQSAPA